MAANETLFDAGFAHGRDVTNPLPPGSAEADYVEGFVRARIKAAREYDLTRTPRYPLPCPPLEVEVVLEHHGPHDALRMLRAGELGRTG